MWASSLIGIREALLSIIIGLGVASFWVVWKNEGVNLKQKSMMRYDAGKGSFVH